MKNINLEKLIEAQSNEAKFMQTLATVCGVIVLIINAAVTFVAYIGAFSAELAVVAALLTILSAIFLWRSDRLRDVAESTKRKYEMYKGLGWDISRREIANLLAGASKSVKEAARSTEKLSYFASSRPDSSKKLLENLEESAWWTKHQARRMTQYAGFFGVAVLVLAFITLIISLQSIISQATADNIARMTISVIVFMFSGGYIRLAFDYNLLAHQADRAERQAYEMRKKSDISEVEAIKLLHDYQIARVKAPPLPTWLWKMMQNELNELWQKRISE